MANFPNQLGFPSARHWAAGLVLSLISSLGMAQAQTAVIPTLDRQVDEAFRQVFKTPGDSDAGLRYARLLVAAGNYEGGVAALEPLLLTANPQPEIRVELAVLYYRLGSYQMAENLLRAALEDARLTTEHRTLVTTLLKDVGVRTQPSQLSGIFMAGMRRQSNPSARSDAAQVYSAGVLTPLAPAFQPQADTDVQLTTRLDHRYDLGLQNEATLISSLVAQITDYRSSSGRELRVNQEAPYNLMWGELTSGVRFKPAAVAVPGLRIRPHLIVSNLAAQGHRYLSNRGLGLDTDYQIDEKTLFSANYEHRRYDYATRIDTPKAAQLKGPDNGLRVQLKREISPGHLISGEFGIRQHHTGRAYYDYSGKEWRITYSATYPSPISGATGGYWSHALWISTAQRKYGAPDPDVSNTLTRKDTDWRLGLSVSVPLSGNWSALMQLEHTRTRSNLPNYQTKNSSVMSTLAYRF